MVKPMHGDEGTGVEIFLNGAEGRSDRLGDERIPEGAIRMALSWLLSSEGIQDGELSITLLDDGAAQDLNRRYLQHDWVPDVLSFPLAPPLLGDIYIGIAQAHRQALAYGVSVEEELLRLAIHGTLHLVGYDHPEDDAGRANCLMTAVQEALVVRVRQAGAIT